MAGKNILPVPENPLKVLNSLTREKIPFIIVGGAAIALHGIPRSTLDIDIVIPAETEAVNKLFSAAKKTGLISRDKYISVLINKPNLLIGQWITFQDKDGLELVDVFFENKKEFNRLLKRAKRIRGKQLGFYIISLDDLEKMKKTSGRPIDFADIALIKEKRKNRI